MLPARASRTAAALAGQASISMQLDLPTVRALLLFHPHSSTATMPRGPLASKQTLLHMRTGDILLQYFPQISLKVGAGGRWWDKGRTELSAEPALRYFLVHHGTGIIQVVPGTWLPGDPRNSEQTPLPPSSFSFYHLNSRVLWKQEPFSITEL